MDIPPGWENRTLPIARIMRVLGRSLLPLTMLCLGPHLVLWGWPEASATQWIAATLWMVGAYLIAVIVHEGLHVLPMFAAGLKPADLRFGVRWSEGVVFVHGVKPVTVRQYRWILATPGLVLGVVPLVAGWVLGQPFLTVFAWLMLVSAVGDWAIFRLIRDLDSADLVQDHPEAVGCLVLRRDTRS